MTWHRGKVRSHRPDRKPEMAFAMFWNKNAKWDKLLFGLKIMIQRLLLDAVFPTPRKWANFNDGFAIKRNPHCIGGTISFFVNYFHLFKNSIGLWDFSYWLTLFYTL